MGCLSSMLTSLKGKNEFAFQAASYISLEFGTIKKNKVNRTQIDMIIEEFSSVVMTQTPPKKTLSYHNHFSNTR